MRKLLYLIVLLLMAVSAGADVREVVLPGHTFIVDSSNRVAIGTAVNHILQAHEIEADPLFISASDFRLQAGSPAINAGVDVSLTTDYWGYPVYSLPDIGAVESQQAAAALRFPLARFTQTTEGNVVRFDNRH